MSSTNNPQPSVKAKLTQEQINKKFQELYKQSQRKEKKLQQLKEQRQKLKEEKVLEQCTFQPKVNQEGNFYGSKPSSFIKREQDWLNRKKKKIEEMAKLSQTKVIQGCSFHPAISSKSIEILQNPNKLKPSQKKIILDTNKKQGNSYKEIYKRKEAEKVDSPLFLLTQKRNEMKKSSQENNRSIQPQAKDCYFSSKQQIFFSSLVKSQECYGFQAQKSAQSSIIKTEEQDTFNSISSINLKTDRKSVNEEEKQKIMIFEDEIQADTQIQDDNNFEQVQDDFLRKKNNEDENI